MIEPEFWDELLNDDRPINPEVAEWFDSVLLKPTAPEAKIVMVFTEWQKDPAKP